MSGGGMERRKGKENEEMQGWRERKEERRGGKETRKGDKRGGLFFLFLTSAANKHYTS